jgi:predicted O-methyltransferase YrrM
MSTFDDLMGQVLNPSRNTDSHLMTMFGIAVGIKAKNILELGVQHGNTSTPLAFAAQLNQGKLTSVDIMPEVQYGVRTYTPPSHAAPYREFVEMDAIEFLEKEAKKGTMYDLVYVDDWHSYPHVKRELELLDQMTTSKSIILLHDLMAHSYPRYNFFEGDKHEFAEGGPTKAVFELDKDKWEWATIPVSEGLTILRKTK